MSVHGNYNAIVYNGNYMQKSKGGGYFFTHSVGIFQFSK